MNVSSYICHKKTLKLRNWETLKLKGYVRSHKALLYLKNRFS